MKLIAILDDRDGMLFNHRRQSQDRVLRQMILELTRPASLWMDAYTFRQFAGQEEPHIRVDEDFPYMAAPGDYCFVEDRAPGAFADRVEEIILFRWNRKYPGDLFFDIPLDKGGWQLTSTEEFAGSSHAKITMEVYQKC